MSAAPFYPQYVHPTPPPTTNTLDREQRTRLLRSTRKLGAMLGTTPFLLEPDVTAPPTPRTVKAHRRKASVFHDPSSSVSSLDSTAEYVFVKSGPSAPYQIQALPFDLDGSSSRGSSLDLKDEKSSRSSLTRTRLPPASIALDLPGSQLPTSEKARGKKTATDPLAQPLLLRLRSVPVPPTDSRVNKLKAQEEKKREKRDSNASSLFGTKRRSSSFSLLLQAPVSPLSPTFAANAPPPMSTERERRRKMAKLTRTLGENIPPELVFGRSPPPSSTQGKKPTGPRSPPATSFRSPPTSSRSASARAPLPPLPEPAPAPKNKGKGKARNDLPPLPPAPPSFNSKRHARPRSLTLDNATLPPASSTSHTAPVPQPQAQGPFVRVHVHTSSDGNPARGQARHAPTSSWEEEEWQGESATWRRKEREWSGEWNVQDMGDVVSALRGLRVR